MRFPHHPEIDLEKYTLQRNINVWGVKAFGAEIMANRKERVLRFFEEALELVQAAGLAEDDVLTLAAHVFSRPAGTVAQELGGVGVTAYTVAEAFGLDLEEAVITEVERVLEKPIEHFQKRNYDKIRNGVTDIKEIPHTHRFSACSDPEEQSRQRCIICDKPLSECGRMVVRFITPRHLHEIRLSDIEEENPVCLICGKAKSEILQETDWHVNYV